jgi:hypothetical protein
MTEYAKGTSVTIERSKAEIEHTLERFGATGFLTGWDTEKNTAMISFRLRGRYMRFRLDLPDPSDPAFLYKKINQTDFREKRTPIQARAAWEQACKAHWRALALLIKAKLAAVEAGVVTLDDEFLAAVLLPDQRTVGEWAQPQVDQAYSSGRMPPLLPLPRDEP